MIADASDPAPPVVVQPPPPRHLLPTSDGGWDRVFEEDGPVPSPTVFNLALPMSGDVTVGFWLTNATSTAFWHGNIVSLYGAHLLGGSDNRGFTLYRYAGNGYCTTKHSGAGFPWAADLPESLYVIDVSSTLGKVRVWVEDMVTPLVEIDYVLQRSYSPHWQYYGGYLAFFTSTEHMYHGKNGGTSAQHIFVLSRSLSDDERAGLLHYPPSVTTGDGGEVATT